MALPPLCAVCALEALAAGCSTRALGGRHTLRFSTFTWLSATLGVLTYSLLPIFAFWSAIRTHQIDSRDISLIVTEIAILQGLLFVAMHRCRSDKLSFGQGVLFTAQSMRTGWFPLDPLLGAGAVCFLLLISACLVLTRNPAHLYHRMVYSFYKNRMRQ